MEEASDALTATVPDGTSHHWAAADVKPAAGATAPSTTYYLSRYGISRGKVTCTRCHNPHGLPDNLTQLRPTTKFELCNECHASWTVNNEDAVLTHPVGMDYTSYASDPRFRAAVDPTVGGTVSGADVQLVGASGTMVGCGSCHRTHFSDSDNSTTDGMAGIIGLGDGYMLRSDGPTRANKSALCQACHVFQAHGKMSDGGEQVGCMVCHGGHNFNNPNYFLLRQNVNTATFGPKTISYLWATTAWDDQDTDFTNGYCEKCHGPAQSIPKGQAGFHPQNADCRSCHKHKVDGGVYSFQNDASVASCGDCHGFPPYKAVRGDRIGSGTDGGYAYSSSTHNYFQEGAPLYKTENTTPHNTHAAGTLAQGTTSDYIFGGGVGACDPCHLNKSTEPSHNPATNPGSYRDIAWSALATGQLANGSTAILTPVYKTSSGTGQWGCTQVYCHSNGGRRNDGAGKQGSNFTFPLTAPIWLDGDNDIVGLADQNARCATCHGNTATSMNASNRNNSASHRKHLGGGAFLKTYSCNVCHKDTAASSSALASGANYVKDGGKHVNGTANVVFNTSYNLGSVTLAGSIYNVSNDGTCTTYCHSNGKGGVVQTPDWDDITTGECGDCHSTAAAGLSAPHAKHMNISGVACADCHGPNAAAGTHGGHVDGAFTLVANACDTCHGYVTGEQAPVWNQSMTDPNPAYQDRNNGYCITCHTGTIAASIGNVKGTPAPNKEHSKTRGHNRVSAYPVSNNQAGNRKCIDCHDLTQVGHIDGDSLDNLLSATGSSCLNCHGNPGTAYTAKKNIVTHLAGKPQELLCLACHDPHGDTAQANIYMVRSTNSTNFAAGATVVFTAKTGADSYDEVDSGANVNYDDICATCHTTGGGSDHNNQTDTGLHADSSTHEGENCFTSCHKPHTESGGAFIAGGGSSCNGCHGNPPASGAHRNGNLISDLELHSITAQNTTAEPRNDCAYCHVGADLYTYDPTGDRATGTGGRQNHGAGNRTTVLAGSVGYTTSGNLTSCSNTPCHISSSSDGFWFNKATGTSPTTWGRDDALYCNACHYYEATVTSNTNNSNYGTRKLTQRHDSHFNKQKQCVACHQVLAPPNYSSHITTPGSGTDIAKITSRAQAAQDEATIWGTVGTDTDPGNPTCSGAGVGLGCHNTKTAPAWNGAPGTIACTTCHVVSGSATADPKSGLHYTTAAGVKAHDGTLGTNGCTECHNSTKPATHANGTWEADSATNQTGTQPRFLNRTGLTYTEGAVNRSTCFDNGTAGLDAASCHSDNGVWKRRWSTEANSTATASGSARCNVCHGQYSQLAGSGGTGWNDGTSHFKTYGGALSTRGDTHRSQAGENNACEDCHSYTTLTTNHDTVTHQVTMNDDAVSIMVTETASNAYCDNCHDDGDPLVAGTYTFARSVFPIQRVAGTNDPKQECNSCHGVGGNGRFWPVGVAAADNVSKNDAGRHEIHMGRLAQAKYYTAAATPADAVTQLLADADTKNRQIELCRWCHPNVPGSNPGHTDTALPAEVSTTMYGLWDTTRVTSDAVTYTGTGLNNTGTCANVNCHNEKNSNFNATFTWHGTGTQNCLLCHNDITVTTAGTTGATHQAHLAELKLGKVINCSSCHGGAPTWSPYAVPSANHINGAFRIGTDVGAAPGATVSFSYSPNNYVNIGAHARGSCGNNQCHNNGKGSPTAAYTWGTAITGTCAACHATNDTLASSHSPHLVATVPTTFGKTIVCADCHLAGDAGYLNSSSDMTGKTGHMDGSVTLASGLTYTGTPATLTVGGSNTYGACTGRCHTNGKPAGNPVTAANWNTPYTNCNICHGLPNTAGNDGLRHDTHVTANAAYVPAPTCGNCHAGATTTAYGSANHLDNTVQTGSRITAHTYGSATCTNSCHVVDASRGDWLDTNLLGCTDCHTGTGGTAKIAGDKSGVGGNNYLHRSGLHTGTLTVSANTHDDFFKNTRAAADGTADCTTCHTTTPSSAHVNNVWNATIDATGNTAINFATNVRYVEAVTPSCAPNNTLSACHTDAGKWYRKWSTSAQNTNGTECNNCHGAWTTWSSGVVPNHAADWDGNNGAEVQSNHSTCKTCHGFNSDADKDANYQLTMHRDNNIQMNSTTQYTPATFTCDNVGCHGAGYHGLADSGWNVQTVSYTVSGGDCAGCHGYPPLEVLDATNYPDGKVQNYPGGGGAHSVAKHVPYGTTKSQGWTPCTPCHNSGDHAMGETNWVPNRINKVYPKVTVNPARVYNGGTVRYTMGTADNSDNMGMGQCFDMNCHFWESPKWDCNP